MTIYMNVNFFLHIHIVTCIFNFEIVHVLLEFTKQQQKNLLYRGFLKYVTNARGSCFLLREAPPGVYRRISP